MSGDQASTHSQETGLILSLKFNSDGLAPAIAQDADTGEVLMMAWMNAQALEETLASGQAVYWSRSRGELWRKGASSGHTQQVLDIRVDCDQDTLLLIVRQTGAACHTGRRSCFYRSVKSDGRLAMRGLNPGER